MVTPTTIGYLEKASAVKDSEVKAWMESNNSHLIPITVGTSTTSSESRISLLKKRTYGSLFQYNESEQDIMMDHFGQRSAGGSEPKAQAIVSTNPVTPVLGDRASRSLILLPASDISDSDIKVTVQVKRSKPTLPH
jgi:hypothetical protein